MIKKSVVLQRPENQIQLLSTLDWGTTVPIAIRVMFTHKFVIMYNMCCVGASNALIHNTKQLKCAMTSERNELPAQVAKRAERAQLLVLYELHNC